MLFNSLGTALCINSGGRRPFSEREIAVGRSAELVPGLVKLGTKSPRASRKRAAAVSQRGAGRQTPPTMVLAVRVARVVVWTLGGGFFVWRAPGTNSAQVDALRHRCPPSRDTLPAASLHIRAPSGDTHCITRRYRARVRCSIRSCAGASEGVVYPLHFSRAMGFNTAIQWARGQSRSTPASQVGIPQAPRSICRPACTLRSRLCTPHPPP